MLGISRVYSVDEARLNHAKRIMAVLKKENLLEKIRYMAVNQRYLCQVSLVPQCLVYPHRNERAVALFLHCFQVAQQNKQ